MSPFRLRENGQTAGGLGARKGGGGGGGGVRGRLPIVSILLQGLFSGS